MTKTEKFIIVGIVAVLAAYIAGVSYFFGEIRDHGIESIFGELWCGQDGCDP